MPKMTYLLVFCALVCSEIAYSQTEFPIPKGLEGQTQFWVDVFSKYSVYQHVIHDIDKPERIYRIVDFREIIHYDELTHAKVRAVSESETNKVKSILKKLSKNKKPPEALTKEEQRVLALFGDTANDKRLKRAAKRVRIQGGMKERFRDGIVRSGRYLLHIRKILREQNLPIELAYLPHVESSFNPHAHSSAGAVGMWQFTRSTGKQYMRIRREMDERRDPILATIAAAKHLKTNYRALGNWPLAITAYNYGMSGLLRAVRKHNTRDFSVIHDQFKSRRFGFASKNFYTEFLAAVEVSRYPEKYFEGIKLDSPMRFETVTMAKSYPIDTVFARYAVDENLVKRMNPALRPSIFQKKKKIPKGYRLRLPPQDILAKADSIRTQLAQLQHRQAVDDPSSVGHPPLAAATTPQVIVDTTPNMEQKVADRSISINRTSAPRTAIRSILPLLNTCVAAMEPDGRVVTVLPEETLGHLADWLNIQTQRLRDENGLPFGRSIVVGQRLKMVFDNASQKSFVERRMEYHRLLFESFFSDYRIINAVIHTMRDGESLWTVANQKYQIPLWVLMVYNGMKSPNRIQPGETLVVPIVEKVNLGSRDVSDTLAN